MEYDYECNTLIRNKLYSTSPTSSSSSSASSSNSFFTQSALMHQQGSLAKAQPAAQHQQKVQKSTNTTSSQFATMSSSTSQIFATASSFNICQNDTVYYSRETIHLLAKFLAQHSNNPIFRSLYAFAPDNLAWLWSFFDWYTPLDLDMVPVQDSYAPFTAVENLVIDESQLYEVNKFFLDAPLVQYKYREMIMIGDVYKFLEHVSKIEQSVVAKALFLIYFPRFRCFIEDPLKEVINVKILKTNLSVIKRVDDTIISLVNSRYVNIDEYKDRIQQGISLPSYIRSILKENNLFPDVKQVAHSDANKQSNSQVKSHLQLKMINENMNECTPALYSPFSVETTVALQETAHLTANIDLNKDNHEESMNGHTNSSVFFPVTKTIDYMAMLEKSNQINDDLDHVSFDKKKALLSSEATKTESFENVFLESVNTVKFDENNNEEETNDDCIENEEDLTDYQDPQFAAKYFDLMYNKPSLNQIEEKLSTTELNLATLTLPQLNSLADSFSNASGSALASPRQELPQMNWNQKDQHSTQFMEKTSSSRLPSTGQQNMNLNTCISPFPSSPKYIPSKQIFYTPKTPSNLSQYREKQQDYSVWSNGHNDNSQSSRLTLPNANRFHGSVSVTPPPSAKFKTSPLSVITNSMLDVSGSSGPIGSKINSPSNFGELISPTAMFNKNHFERLNESLNYPSASGLIQDDINEYLKHQFYGSPVTRMRDRNTHGKNYMKKSEQMMLDYQNSEAMRFNTVNNELSTNYNNVSYQPRNTELMLEEPYSSKSPSSTSSGTVPHFHNPNHRVHTSTHQHTWLGRLPPKTYQENSIYSRKVFLGGLPWDVNQTYLVHLLQKYGSVKLEIPGKDQKHPRVSNISKNQERSTPGYVYIIFEHESAVQRMLTDCRKEIKNGGEHYYYTIFIPPSNNGQSNQSPNNNYYNFNGMGNKRGKAKEVEVIPWNQEDTSFVPQNKTSMLPAKIDAKTTIFVGALHGMLNANGLAKVMNEVFGEVIHAGLDTDKYKYPIGSGRVTFRNRASYVKAIKSKFVTIKANQEPADPSPKFEKTIQIDPYLEDAKCCKCNNNRSFFFCRNEFCLDYYCENCWKNNHDMIGNGDHQSLSRQNKPDQMNKSFK